MNTQEWLNALDKANPNWRKEKVKKLAEIANERELTEQEKRSKQYYSYYGWEVRNRPSKVVNA